MLTHIKEELIRRIDVEEMLNEDEQNSIEADVRRQVVEHYMNLGDKTKVTVAFLGKFFGMDPAAISRDRRVIRQRNEALLEKEPLNIAKIVDDIEAFYDEELAALEKGRKQCRAGTTAYLQYCKQITETFAAKNKVLQDIGRYPKNMGTHTVNKFEWHAFTEKDGSILTKVGPKPEPKLIEGEFITNPPVGEVSDFRKSLDEEFQDMPMQAPDAPKDKQPAQGGENVQA